MKKRRAENNKGFSMVELLIAFGIMGVIVTTVGYMMTTSSKTYSSLSTEAQLQAEAQLVANAISELAIDSFDAGNTYENKLESNIDSTVRDRLILLSKTKTDAARYIITHSDKKLYLQKQEFDLDADEYKSAESAALLGQYIEDFEVNLSRVKDENMISFTLTYVKNGKKYVGDYQVLMRNRAYADQKDKKPEGVPEPKNMTIAPKTVYVDIVNGSPTLIRENSITANGTAKDSVDFDSSVMFTNGSFGEDDTGVFSWEYIGGSSALNNLTVAASGSSGDSKVKKNSSATLSFESNKKQEYISLPNAEIRVVASYTLNHNHISKDEAGAEVKTPKQHVLSKEARVRLRIVRKILWSGSSGTSNWKTSYVSMGGKEVTDANAYGAAKSTVTILPYIDQSNVSTDLTWKIEQRGSGGTWSECTDANMAQLMSGTVTNGVRTTSGARQSMAIKLGANASNDVSFKITATSVFDNSVSAEYILGVIPVQPDDLPKDGLHSRGYKIPLEQFFTDPDDPHKVQGDRPDVYEIVDIQMTGGDNNDNADNTQRFHWDKTTKTFYWDINSFSYSNLSQKKQFYKQRTINMNITYTYRKADGSLGTEYYQGYHYTIEAVKVSPTATGMPVACVKKGDEISYVTLMDHYNVTTRSDFGVYIKDPSKTEFSSNINRDGWEGTNKYLTVSDVTTYGNSEKYIDKLKLNVNANIAEKTYPTDALTMRVTVDDYYNIDKDTDSYYDYKIYIANVEGQGVFLPGPYASTGISEDNLPTTAETAKEITGITTSGLPATGKVYKDGNKIKCIYGAITYTYNKTYNYWKK